MARRVQYVPVTCEVCGTVREYPPSVLRVRGKIRFCSVSCRAIASRKPDRLVPVNCDRCGKSFKRRHDHIGRHHHTFCSRDCAIAFRRKPGAKWRDPEQIRQYMREYIQRHRDKHNERSREWSRKNRESRNKNQRLRRANGHGWGRKGHLRRLMLQRYGGSCLCCGATDRIEVDHVVPVSKGGATTLDNVQPLCRSCNASKGDKVIDYRLKKKLVRAVYGIDVREV